MTTAELLQRAREGKNVKAPPLAEAVGMSLPGFYAAIRRNQVAAVRVGRAVMIPSHEVLRLLGAEERPAA